MLLFNAQINSSFLFLFSAGKDAEQTSRDVLYKSELFEDQMKSTKKYLLSSNSFQYQRTA